MNEHLDPTGAHLSPQDLDIEKKLRPLSFEDFTGQDQALENLKVFVQAANLRNEVIIERVAILLSSNLMISMM